MLRQAAAASCNATFPDQVPGQWKRFRPPGDLETIQRVCSARRDHCASLKRRHQHESIRDIEICITGRQALAIEKHRFGHRQCLDAQRFAILISHLTQQRKILLAAARNSLPTGLALCAITTVRGSVNRAKSSTCPCVSSPAIPFSQPYRVMRAEIVSEKSLPYPRVSTLDSGPGHR